MHYNIDELKTYNKSIIVERPFFSPFAKWAGGINLAQQFRIDSMNYHNDGYVRENYKFNTQDYWAGNAIRIFKGNTEDEKGTTNLILTAHVICKLAILKGHLNFMTHHNVYTNEKFYLAGIGITTRKYIQDKYIFNYGLVTEDVCQSEKCLG